MKKFLLGLVGLAAMGMAAPASAADLAARPYTKAPPPMVAALYDWSGFYLGVNGGAGWARKCWDINAVNVLGAIVPVAPFREGCHDATGAMAGGQIGYRWQSASWVFGLEGMGDWADLKGSNTSVFFGPATSNQSRVRAYGQITGQVGYAWNNVLWYLEGGVALADDKYNGFITGTNVVFDTARETRVGGVVGTGIDFGFAQNWSAGIKYDHAFMGNRNNTFTSLFAPVGAFSRTDNIRQDIDMVTVHVNYRWGGPIIAKY
jgi:outer membrane immunogenic protein